MEILGVAALLALLTLATGESFNLQLILLIFSSLALAGSIVKQHKCNLEGGEGLCGWQIISQQGITAGITRASDTAPPALPVDYSPGTENGKYLCHCMPRCTFIKLQAPIFISTGPTHCLLKQEC